jgi:hypothetical protein
MDTIHAAFTFPKGFMMTYETRLGNSTRRAEVLFYGTKGTFDTLSWTMTEDGKVQPSRLQGGIYPTSAFTEEDDQPETATVKVEAKRESISHPRNWLQCMRSRKQPNASVEHGYRHSVISIMAHRAADTGKRLVYDKENREIREG